MKRLTLLLALLISFSHFSYSKKDINAWKNEKNLEQQYEVFKTNLKFWSGSYFLTEIQLDEFYNALKDTIGNLENSVDKNQGYVMELKNELDSNKVETEQIHIKLNESVKHQNAISLLGMRIHKNIYTAIMSLIILGLLVLLGVVFMMFKRSNKITSHTKKEYNELKDEFEAYKKSSLERYTKMNMELHKTRLELKKR